MAEERLLGRCAAPGLVQGVVSLLEPPRPPDRTAGSPSHEAAALLQAIGHAQNEVAALAAQLSGEAAEMVGVQFALLCDPELARSALAAIDLGAPAHLAWADAMAAESEGPIVAEIDDIRDRVMAHLCPGALDPAIVAGAILAAPDLTLSRFLAIDWSQVGALVLTQGSPAGHVATLARARFVPMVVGLGTRLPQLAGRTALVDAAAGEVILDPADTTSAAFARRFADQAASRNRAATFRAGPAITVDGTPIAIHLNIGALSDLDGLDPALCDGIGLVRTELLCDDDALRDEAAQYFAYRRIAEWAKGRPVVVRTLDAGGDKPIRGVTPVGESNPFLGLRGLRLSLQSPGLFRIQLRALARAGTHGDLRIMLPMVTLPEELAAAAALLDAVLRELARDGLPARRPLLGIMIEVPAAALMIGRFDADFYSIGSNDLTQYVTAAGRDIVSVATLADPLNPAVLSLIETACRHGRAVGREVSLCGDAAAEPRCLAALLHAGLRSVSVPPSAVGRTKQAIAAIDLRRPAP